MFFFEKLHVFLLLFSKMCIFAIHLFFEGKFLCKNN